MSTITIGGTEYRLGAGQGSDQGSAARNPAAVTPEPARPTLWNTVMSDPKIPIGGTLVATGIASSIASYQTTASAAARGGDDAAQGAVRSNAGKWYAAAAIGALVLGAVVLANSGGGGSAEATYTVTFDTKPDLTAAQEITDRDARKIAVFNAINDHYNANKGPIEAELVTMQDEGIVTAWTPVPASNGITVTVADGQGDAFLERMQAVANVGDASKDDLQALAGSDIDVDTEA